MNLCVKDLWNVPSLRGLRSTAVLGLAPEGGLWEGQTLLPHPLKSMEDQMNHPVGKIGVVLAAILEDTPNNSNNFSHAHLPNKTLEDKIKEEAAITTENKSLVSEIHEINVYIQL